MVRIRQMYDPPSVPDVAAKVKEELDGLALDVKVTAGQSVAITAGSRGIANIDVIIRAIVEHVRSLGGEPFVVPAMGSHGGATVEGQLQLLADYGITEELSLIHI